MQDYDNLYNLVKNRRTPRFVSQDDIPEIDIQKIYSLMKDAPSFDKVFPYDVYFLTNSASGIIKKEQIIEHYRCGKDVLGDTFNGKEINQVLLSGLVIAFISNYNKLSETAQYKGNTSIVRHALQDVMISGTYAMLAGRSLGYQTGMLSAITQRQVAASILTNKQNCELQLCVVVAKSLETPTVSGNKQPYTFKNQDAWIFLDKHSSKNVDLDITII